jgi:hypothetical protein
MKGIIRITVLCLAATLLLGGCALLDAQELEDIHISEDGRTLTWGERVYDAYGLVSEDQYIGKRLGVADAGASWDSGSWIFELAGVEATEWLIEKPRAIMSIHTVYRARGVTDVPEGVISFQENADGG